jgi:hypothetical protein
LRARKGKLFLLCRCLGLVGRTLLRCEEIGKVLPNYSYEDVLVAILSRVMYVLCEKENGTVERLDRYRQICLITISIINISLSSVSMYKKGLSRDG